MTAVLWHIEISHFNEKARWALDYKRVPHVRKAPLPGLHGFFALAATRGAQRRLPVLKLDGRGIGDSTAIIAALEEHVPEPALYPAEAADRARALALEDFFDEELGPHLRRYVFQQTLGDVPAVIDAVLPRASAARVRTMRMMAPVLQRAVRLDYGVDEARAEQSLGKIHAAMDRLEEELGSEDYLVGDRFTVADLTAAALFTPLLCPPGRQYPPRTLVPRILELREELAARPGGAWVAEMYARHRGESAEVAR